MDTSSVQYIEIDSGADGQRVDNYLIRILKGVPKTRIYRIIRKGEVRVNKKRVKASSKLLVGDSIRVPPIRTSDSETPIEIGSWLKEMLHKSIVYEDDWMLVLNKPPGIAVHGGSGLSFGVIEALRQLFPSESQLELVHRLDKGTSGCLMVAKKRKSLRSLQNMLREKSEQRESRMEKHYIAIVHGKWPKRKQHVAVPLEKMTLEGGGRISRVSAQGKPALTEITVLKQSEEFSLLAVKPITGRTHQIRVHCQHVGFPIVGDDKYGNRELDSKQTGAARLMLHANRLVIPEMGNESQLLTVEASLDREMTLMSERI